MQFQFTNLEFQSNHQRNGSIRHEKLVRRKLNMAYAVT